MIGSMEHIRFVGESEDWKSEGFIGAWEARILRNQVKVAFGIWSRRQT